MASADITDGRLGVLDAARRLRITPELLFSYVKHGAKGRDGRRLLMVADAPGNLFAESELEAFDAYLREPWAEPGADRPAIPRAVRDYLKVEAGGGCARCVSGAPLEEAHIEAWEAVRSHHHHNLIRLCRNCHRAYDEGAIPRAEVERLKERCVQTVQRRLSGVRPNGWPFAGAPAAAAILVGRDVELGEVASALIMGGSVLVEGAGGIGKTQLVLSALRGIEEQRPVVWVGVEAVGSPEALEDAIRQRVAEVGLAPADQLSRMLDDGRACLVLDGVERLPDGRDFVADLIDRLVSDTSDTILVVTSQMSLPSFVPDAHVRLRPVDRSAAEAVLRRGLTDEAALDEQSLSALLDFADGHPLTLKILSALVRHFGSGRDVLRRLGDLRSKAVLMPGRRRHDATTSLEKSLAVAFEDLGPIERKLLWMVAMSPAGFRSGMHPIDRVGIGDPFVVAADLRGWNLIDLMRDPAFDLDHPAAVVLTMLSPIRAFVLDEMDDEPGEARLSRERDFAFQVSFLISRLQYNFVKEGAARLGLSLMDRELPNAMAVFDLARSRIDEDAGFLNIVSSLANSTMMLLFTSGRFRLGQEIMRAAASDMSEAGQWKEAIHLLLQMQVLAERSGDEQWATFALNEAERLGSGAQGEALAMVRQMQSSAAEHQRDFGAAATLAREALKLYDALGGNHYNIGFAAFQLGRALEFGGDPEAALPYYRRAIEVWDRESDPINRASTYHHIGNCEADGGRWRSAMDAYRLAGSGFVELDAVEFISNALGEAGLIVPHLDELVDLPSRLEIEAGLRDVVARIADLLNEPQRIRDSLRVSCKKLGGMISLAIHTGNSDLLESTADSLADKILWPLAEGYDETVPTPIRVLVYHVQWITRLCAFLSMGIGTVNQDEEFEIVITLAGRGFPGPDHATMAPWIASFLRRVRGNGEMTAVRIERELATVT